MYICITTNAFIELEFSLHVLLIVIGYQFLFEKQLFTSDTGRLCRLIIPKHFAEEMFKFYTADEILQVKDPLNGEGLSVRIYDLDYKIEETFVLKYWKSSDSYFFIHGWIIFVR